MTFGAPLVQSCVPPRLAALICSRASRRPGGAAGKENKPKLCPDTLICACCSAWYHQFAPKNFCALPAVCASQYLIPEAQHRLIKVFGLEMVEVERGAQKGGRWLAVLCCAVLCCAVLCCAVLCCAVLYCILLCCAVLCCAVLCCAVL